MARVIARMSALWQLWHHIMKIEGGSHYHVLQDRLPCQTIGSLQLLDAVIDDSGTLFLFFNSAVAAEAVQPPQGVHLTSCQRITGATVMRFEVSSPAKALSFVIDGSSLTLAPTSGPKTHLTDRNCLLATRNGENAAVVLDWLAFHHRHHGAQSAVILDRARPVEAPSFADALEAGIQERGLDIHITLVSANAPLGHADLPAEADPFCVPEAPGKDRHMAGPPDVWRAPLGANIWYEIARRRFLDKARAVANIDVHDLIDPSGGSVFDRAAISPTGMIALRGRHVFPWRLRRGTKPQFGDHICVQFDSTQIRKRWCVAPGKARQATDWRMVKVSDVAPAKDHPIWFDRHMALRHDGSNIARLVPKASLIEDPALVARAADLFEHDPIRLPAPATLSPKRHGGRSVIVTTMKNEGPFILEWLAHHRAVGFKDFLVYSNDCTDGTDVLLQLLMEKGWLVHRDNPYRQMKLRPQHAALQSADDEPCVRQADWLLCADVDEFVNIKTGDGTLTALFDAAPDANVFSMTWRLFGNADRHHFVDAPVTTQFHRCAPEVTRKPHQAWGFKTLFANQGLFRKLGVHRPKGLNPQHWESVKWVNGSGAPMPRSIYRNGWRSSMATYGYDLVQLNHYAVRSAESFLVKRERGRVNHVDRDQGLSYWFRMNNNADEDRSILARISGMQAVLDQLMDDPEIAQAHAFCVDRHRSRIVQLRANPTYAAFYAQLTSPRMQALSRLHGHFGANVFLQGPGVVPDDIAACDPQGTWFFTVPPVDETSH